MSIINLTQHNAAPDQVAAGVVDRERLYNSAARWAAEYDGESWTVGSVDKCAAEEAAHAY